jgi:polar amino acid transport system substrate-binding protein
MQFFTNSELVKVYGESISTGNDLITPFDNIAIVVKFSNGSVGNLVYLANGDKSLPKEKIEVFCAGSTGIINDFRDGSFLRNGKVTKLKSSGKGHKEEIETFMNILLRGQENPLTFRSICLTTLTTFKILDSLFTGMPQDVSLENF